MDLTAAIGGSDISWLRLSCVFYLSNGSGIVSLLSFKALVGLYGIKPISNRGGGVATSRYLTTQQAELKKSFGPAGRRQRQNFNCKYIDLFAIFFTVMYHHYQRITRIAFFTDNPSATKAISDPLALARR